MARHKLRLERGIQRIPHPPKAIQLTPRHVAGAGDLTPSPPERGRPKRLAQHLTHFEFSLGRPGEGAQGPWDGAGRGVTVGGLHDLRHGYDL